MALPPESNEAFLREVDEELRREQLGSVWRRYGLLLIGLVIAGLALFAGYLWWQSAQAQRRGEAGEQMSSAIEDSQAGKTAAAAKTFRTLAQGDNQGYRAAAKLALAARLLEQGRTSQAIAAYNEIASDRAIAQPFRDLATVRATLLGFDDLKPEQVIARLKPLAVPGAPWFGTAGELTAMSYYKLGQPAKAGAVFGAIAGDQQVPDSLRARAVRIAGALGVDAAASVAASKRD